MTYKIFKIDEIDLDRITYSKPVSYNKDISSIYISYNDKNKGRVPLLMQLPSLYCIEGINKTMSKSITHELLLCVLSKNTKSTYEVKTFLENLDKKFIMDAKSKYSWGENSKKLTYKVLMRQTNDSNPLHNNGVLKIKFIKNDGFETCVFNKDKSLVNYNNYTETFSNRCYVKLIIECVSLWKNKSNIFGLYIRPHQVRVDYGLPPSNVLTDYSFREESDEENIIHTETHEIKDNFNHDSDDSSSDIINSELENEFKSASFTELKNQESSKYYSHDLFKVNVLSNTQPTSDKRTDTYIIQDAVHNIHDENLNSSTDFSDEDLNFTGSSKDESDSDSESESDSISGKN